MVTDVATVRNWTLALAGSKKAELEIAVNSENFGLVDIFGHSDAITVQAKDIEYHERIVDRKPVFFKAKKLTVRNGKIDAFISDLLKEGELKNEWVKSFFDYEFHNDEVYHKPSHKISPISILDMLQANELNPNTALKYFKWINANLDDIELLLSDNMEENIKILHDEIDWLEKVTHQVISSYLMQEGHENKWIDIPLPDLDDSSETYYGAFVKEWNLNVFDRLALALTLAVHLKPNVLDVFFGKNKIYDRPFTEFGGSNGQQA